MDFLRNTRPVGISPRKPRRPRHCKIAIPRPVRISPRKPRSPGPGKIAIPGLMGISPRKRSRHYAPFHAMTLQTHLLQSPPIHAFKHNIV